VTVPLVVITGFLGAGKTTLVNRLLARRRERNATGKLGVIVNELGEIGIDGELLGGPGDGLARQIELPGGCVCCVLGDELGETLLELVARNPELEAILLETTGVADPLPISWAVARDPVAARVRLAAVVTLVDACNFLPSRAVSTSVDAQVAYADVLLMTKKQLTHDISDGVAGRGSPEHGDAELVARQLAPRALIRNGTTDDHAAWLEALLADPPLDGTAPPLGSAVDGAALPREGDGVASPNGQAAHNDTHHHHTDECRHLDSTAAHGIDSVWIPVDAPVDLEELEDQLAELPANYVRIKGIVRVTTDDDAVRWAVVHRVGPRVSSEDLAAHNAGQPQQSRIVALGPSVSRADLARCVATASGSRTEEPGDSRASALLARPSDS
jgi:G3E family GTPase